MGEVLLTYTRYLLKLGVKNKLNLIPLLIPILIMIVLFIMNTQALEKSGYLAFLNEDLQLVDNQNDQQKSQELGTYLTKNIELKKKSIELAKEEKWSESLAIQVDLMKETELQDIDNYKLSSNEDLVNNIYMRYARYTKLMALNAEPQLEGIETKGFNFVYRMMDSIFPLVFTLCLIAFISTIFNASVIGRIDTEQLFPETPFVLYMKKISMLTIISFLFYFLFLGSSFILSSIINGTGTLDYPINLFMGNFMRTVPILKVLIKANILQFFSILFIVSAVSFISTLAKNGLTTLFISIIALLSAILLTGKIAPVNAVLHLLPTTYVNAIQVVTNKLAFETYNSAITFTTGIVVLLVSSIILMTTTTGIKLYIRKREMLLK